VRGEATVDDRLDRSVVADADWVRHSANWLLYNSTTPYLFLCVPCHNLFQVLSNVAALVVEIYLCGHTGLVS
jgi:hypothetical protein